MAYFICLSEESKNPGYPTNYSALDGYGNSILRSVQRCVLFRDHGLPISVRLTTGQLGAGSMKWTSQTQTDKSRTSSAQAFSDAQPFGRI